MNKKVISLGNIIVKNGASSESLQLNEFPVGTVFEVVGMIDDWYKVGSYGKFGWIEKSMVEDFNSSIDSDYLVETRNNFAIEDADMELSENRESVTSRPIIKILSPTNNSHVYNRTDMEILAIDRTFGIGSIDIRINGKPIEGSGIRGLRIVDSQNRDIQKTYPLFLNKGENEITVTVYNTKNVASDSEVRIVYSQGVQNPPSLYVLSVGVSEYEIDPEEIIVTFAPSK